MGAPQFPRRTVRPLLIENIIVIAATLFILEQHSRLPEVNLFGFFICGFAIVCVGLAYFIRLARVKRGEIIKPHAIISWLVFPAAIALTYSSAVTHWPAVIRFYLSRTGFEELVAEAHRGQKLGGFPRRVGLYWIESARDFNYETREGAIGFVTGVAVLDECGIYYDNNNPTPSHYLTTRIAPGWYLTEW